MAPPPTAQPTGSGPAPFGESFAEAPPTSAGSHYTIVELLDFLVRNHGSDLHCKVGSPPRIRVDGRLLRLNTGPLTVEDTMEYFATLCAPHDALAQLRREHELDFGHSVPGLGRFRVNAFMARGSIGLAVRRIPVGASSLETLGLPPIIGQLALEPRGLVLVTGQTGSGKTTTLASMIDLINNSRDCHIITIEDPIEVLHPDSRAMINQREVRHDTDNFPSAIRSAMRQDPDVIFIGEMRDAETVRAAIAASSTGHLVLSTMHTTTAAEALTRMIDFFQPHEQQQARVTLASSLRGVICQRLAPTATGSGRQAVVEVLLNTPRIAEAITEGMPLTALIDIMEQDNYNGMQTFDQHLFELIKSGQIAVAGAMQVCTTPDDLLLQLRMNGVIDQ